MRIILLVIPACLLVLTEARRMQIRPRVTEPRVYYEEEDNQAAEDEFDTVAVYQPRTRALPSPRSKDALHGSKPPPVQTIRNYNKVNDDGSFTFGYEAADGSFKEETRGTDCVVRGKYGYIDPDGNKREFTYVSGNPCDPNAPKDEEEEEPEKEEEELSGPANYPVVRPIPRPVSVRPTYHQPTTTRAPTTIFQTEYQLDDDASQELTEDDLKPQLRPSAFRRPSTLVQVTPSTAIYESSPSSSPSLFRLASTPAQYQTTATPVLRSQPTVTSSVYQSLGTTTRRPVTRHPSVRAQSVAITPRPHVAQVAAQYVSPSSTERPDSLLYAQTHPTISPLRTTTAANAPHLDFAAELERYVNTVGSHVPAAPVARPQTAQASPQPTSRVKLTGQTSVTAASAAAEPIYQSELVYDPATGQYNTQLYQTLPQTVGDFSLSHKLQPFVAQSQSLLGLQQLQQYQQAQRPVYKQAQSAPTPTIAQPQEVLYRKQQAQLLQQSQQLYAQQQRRQQQQQQPQQQQPHRLQLLESQREPQAFYYVAPLKASAAPTSLAVGQIDQFLRGSRANNY
ncbi:PREDICTED: putative mediator of RNA polymerase II transcription subunit 12 isoform X1 [Acromyrmex echinatior]|nr:PREDICTED: putative mediator of RNA polymerase II transcription subunit 12 isoform X1 [Acromyrmex echinatior]